MLANLDSVQVAHDKIQAVLDGESSTSVSDTIDENNIEVIEDSQNQVVQDPGYVTDPYAGYDYSQDYSTDYYTEDPNQYYTDGVNGDVYTEDGTYSEDIYYDEQYAYQEMVILSKVKILANYLPQFHQTPENDAWWGEGYTDWTAVKASKPLFNGHTQPRVPLDNDYYDLSNADSIRKQALLAHEYGISGFAIYHYWFSSKQKLLTKPAELLLEQKDLPIEYLFIWDNNTWKRTWSNVKGAVTMASSEYEKKVDPQDSGILANWIMEMKWIGRFILIIFFHF